MADGIFGSYFRLVQTVAKTGITGWALKQLENLAMNRTTGLFLP
jgi:hypothetical protein